MIKACCKKNFRLSALAAIALVISSDAQATYEESRYIHEGFRKKIQEKLINIRADKITVIDGDMFKYVDDKNITHNVRIWGIDAPELDQKCHPSDEKADVSGSAKVRVLKDRIDRKGGLKCYILDKKDRWNREYGLCYFANDGVNLVYATHATKTISPPIMYDRSSWMHPSEALYRVYVGDIIMRVDDVFFRDKYFRATLEDLEKWAIEYDKSSIDGGDDGEEKRCTFNTPASWRAFKRDIARKDSSPDEP